MKTRSLCNPLDVLDESFAMRFLLLLFPLRQRGHAAIVQALIHHKADIDGQVRFVLLASTNCSGSSPIMFLLTLAVSMLFVRQTAQGSTALMLACKRGHEDVVRVLLTAGAELHQKDSRGRTARDTASKRHHETILAMLHPAKQMRLMQVRSERKSRLRYEYPPSATRSDG